MTTCRIINNLSETVRVVCYNIAQPHSFDPSVPNYVLSFPVQAKSAVDRVIGSIFAGNDIEFDVNLNNTVFNAVSTPVTSVSFMIDYSSESNSASKPAVTSSSDLSRRL